MAFGRALAPSVLLLALAACAESAPPADGTTEPPAAEPLTPAQQLAAQGCNWVKVFDPTVLNFAYPDTSAHYWLALAPNPGPLGRIRLSGRVPEVRYYAFNAYNALTAPYDAIADYQIVPQDGAATPFQGPARVDRSLPVGAPYTVEVVFTPRPETRAPNTLYSAELASLIGVSLPNPVLSLIVYRAYLPRGDVSGGVGLPLIELETPSGAVIPVGGGDTCVGTLSRLAEALLLGAVNRWLTETAFPETSLPLPPLTIPGMSSPPTFRVFYGLAAGVQDAGVPVPELLIEGSTLGGFFSTLNTRYAYALFSRSYGSLYLVRGKAPRHVDGSTDPQLRYWSLCQNEFFTQRVVACLADRDTVLDTDGYYNVVVSDQAMRPAAAEPDQGYNWLPWGAYPDGDFIVRHMLPDSEFAEAFQNVPRGVDAESVSGPYLPVATYCEPAVFADAVAAGLAPAAVFAACRDAASGSITALTVKATAGVSP